ncbi:hypothetical protein GCM10009823_30370 [Brevibacterium salitolerans]|uniref:Uncharacterized protein n=1 Tax=Brevibacterium salitolerans TaxID=1403566 RepID=A0ABN2X5H5_9MICO
MRAARSPSFSTKRFVFPEALEKYTRLGESAAAILRTGGAVRLRSSSAGMFGLLILDISPAPPHFVFIG